GSYRTALRELDAAGELHVRFPRQLEPDKARELTRWRPQVALLADLLAESVNEIVRHSIGLADREWDAVFRERYAGRSLLLDARDAVRNRRARHVPQPRERLRRAARPGRRPARAGHGRRPTAGRLRRRVPGGRGRLGPGPRPRLTVQGGEPAHHPAAHERGHR